MEKVAEKRWDFFRWFMVLFIVILCGNLIHAASWIAIGEVMHRRPMADYQEPKQMWCIRRCHDKCLTNRKLVAFGCSWRCRQRCKVLFKHKSLQQKSKRRGPFNSTTIAITTTTTTTTTTTRTTAHERERQFIPNVPAGGFVPFFTTPTALSTTQIFIPPVWS